MTVLRQLADQMRCIVLLVHCKDKHDEPCAADILGADWRCQTCAVYREIRRIEDEATIAPAMTSA